MFKCGFLTTPDKCTHLCYYDGADVIIEFDDYISTISGIPQEYIKSGIKLDEVELYIKYTNENTYPTESLYIHSDHNIWLFCTNDLSKSENYGCLNMSTGVVSSINNINITITKFPEDSYRFRNFMYLVTGKLYERRF